MNPGNRDESLKAVIARATVDRAFRTKLLQDPAAAIFEETGERVPHGVQIKFIEKDPGVETLIVLPDLIADGGELSVEELDQVAGGTAWCDTASCENYTE